MAEGIARSRYGHRATFASGGTHAITGSGPSAHSVTAAAEIGIDIAYIRASHIPAHPIPDKIYVMTEHHRSHVVRELPDLADRVELLDPFGHPVPDPYGMDLDSYRAARDQIVSAIEQRASEWEVTQ